MADGKPSADQLPEEIRKMLEERAKAQAAADLDYALTCFMVDQRGSLKKIKDVSFDPLPATSISKDGSSNVAGAKADVDKKTKEEVDHLLAKLEKEGLQIDGKIPSIIDDGITKTKAEAARENINKPKRKWRLLHKFACIAFGFIVGMQCAEHAFISSYNSRRREKENKCPP